MAAPSARFRWQAVVCAAGLLYLAGDLWVFHGPLLRRLERSRPDSPRSIARAKAAGAVARVYFQPITRGQLDRAVFERLWLEGREWADVPPGERTAVVQAALDELIDRELLRIEAQRHGAEVAVSEEEIERAYQRFATRFAGEGELRQALAREGLSPDGWRKRIAARLEQEKWVEHCLGPQVKVGDDEARAWFAKHGGKLGQPERLRARQVFLATLERDPDEAKALLDQAAADLAAGKKDFAALAAELSDDEATRANGGDLGWVARGRLPADFAKPVFELPVGSPGLIRTKLGWHLVEVLEKKPAAPRAFEEARAEVIAALEVLKRREAVMAFRETLRRREADRIEIWLEP
jgi:parvulin-like peptidyl-prolyl isomerase